MPVISEFRRLLSYAYIRMIIRYHSGVALTCEMYLRNVLIFRLSYILTLFRPGCLWSSTTGGLGDSAPPP